MKVLALVLTLVVFLGIVGEAQLKRRASTTSVLGTSMTADEAKASEQEVRKAMSKVDPNNLDSLKNLTNMKTAGGKVISRFTSEILKRRQESKIDVNSDKLGEITTLENLCHAKKCHEIAIAAKRLIASSEKYSKDITLIYKKWSAATSNAGLEQSPAYVLRVSRSIGEWARSVLDLADFCSKHTPAFDSEGEMLVFQDKDLSEATRLLDRTDDAQAKLASAVRVIESRLERAKRSAKRE